MKFTSDEITECIEEHFRIARLKIITVCDTAVRLAVNEGIRDGVEECIEMSIGKPVERQI